MKFVTYTVISICVATVASAADSNAAQRCKAIADSTARVACYDKLFEAAPTTAPAPAAPAVAAPVVAAPVVAAPVAAGAATASLGDESVPRSRSEREGTGPASLTAKVAVADEFRSYTYRITLDNGSVWQQEEMKKAFILKAGDTVYIEKGSMGGFLLARVNNGKPGGTWIRVTRRK